MSDKVGNTSRSPRPVGWPAPQFARFRYSRDKLLIPRNLCCFARFLYLARMPTQPSKTLETFDNPHPQRDYTIRIRMPEFTCLCPKTGQPDFAVLNLEYVPDRRCVELKSLKMYIWSFRDEGAFHEDVTNQILDKLVSVCEPRFMRLTAEFNVRGGIYTTVVAEHRDPAWKAPERVELP